MEWAGSYCEPVCNIPAGTQRCFNVEIQLNSRRYVVN